MAFRTGRTHFINFRVLNGTTSVSGLSLSDFSTVFLVDEVTCILPLTFIEVETGLYCCSYVPNNPGFYVLELANTTYNTRTLDTVEIDSDESYFGVTNAVVLTQDYGGAGRFKVTQPNPATFTLYIYKSSDWVTGNTNLSFIVNSTAIDTSGNWVNSSLTVVHDTYTVVITDGTNTIVLASFMAV